MYCHRKVEALWEDILVSGQLYLRSPRLSSYVASAICRQTFSASRVRLRELRLYLSSNSIIRKVWTESEVERIFPYLRHYPRHCTSHLNSTLYRSSFLVGHSRQLRALHICLLSSNLYLFVKKKKREGEGRIYQSNCTYVCKHQLLDCCHQSN